MLHRLVLLAFVLSFAGAARADDVVECDKSRDTCDAKILELCPAGAEVLDEQELAGSAGPRYRMTFRCRGGEAAATAAPLPGQAPPPAPITGSVAAPVADVSALQLELRTVEARLADLKAERKRHSLVGPIILTAGGFGAAAVFGLTAIAAAADDGSSGCYDYDDDDFSGSCYGDDDSDGLIVTSTVLAVIGAGVGVGGLIWLMRRSKARKANDPEIESLKLRQEQLRMQGVSYSFAIDPVGGRLILRGRF